MKLPNVKTTSFLALLLTTFMLTSIAFAANPYGPNVTAHSSQTANVSGGSASVDNTATTGVSVSLSGLTGVSSATVTTESLNAPASGVTTFSTSGTAVYFDVKVTLPSGVTAPSGATATVCLTDPTVSSSSTLQYWSGSSWVSATNIVVTGTQICGNVPVSALTGTNFVIAPAAAADYTWLYITVIVIALVIIIAVGVMMMRRRRT